MLAINGDTFCEGDGTFIKGVYLYIFNCLCFDGEISLNSAVEQTTEEKGPIPCSGRGF